MPSNVWMWLSALWMTHMHIYTTTICMFLNNEKSWIVWHVKIPWAVCVCVCVWECAVCNKCIYAAQYSCSNLFMCACVSEAYSAVESIMCVVIWLCFEWNTRSAKTPFMGIHNFCVVFLSNVNMYNYCIFCKTEFFVFAESQLSISRWFFCFFFL